MRIRPWHVLIFIILLTLVTGWVSLPGTTLDVGGIKENVKVHEGLDLQGGVQVLLEARPPAGQSVDKDTLNGTRNTIERRVNGLGVSEPLIQTRGNNQIIVELPGLTDVQSAIDVLRTTALLEIVNTNGSYLPPGTYVNTSLGDASSVLNDLTPTPAATPGASPQASPQASPAASPVQKSPSSACCGRPAPSASVTAANRSSRPV